jgi:hypothetical protein
LIGGNDSRDDADAVYTALSQYNCLAETRVNIARDHAMKELQAADVLLVLDNTEGAMLQVPAKLFEYIPTGKPILAVTSPQSPTERILAQSGIRYECLYPSHADSDVDAAIVRLLEPYPPARMSKWFVDTFDAKRRTEVLARIFDGLQGDQLGIESRSAALQGRSS